MTYRKITPADYPLLLELDKKVYPTDNPVTSEILNQWYANNPEFGIIFEDKGKILGMAIVIPLSRKGWEGIISGKLVEADIKAEHVFNPNVDNEIGLHCYHIEKFGPAYPFFIDAYKALNEIVHAIKSDIKVIGVSGYAVTKSGISLAYNRFNRHEGQFISDEHLMSKDGRLEIIKKLTQKKLDELIAEGYVYHNRCKMLIVYPEEVSLIWTYLKP